MVKQADLVLAMYKCGDLFSDQEKRRNFAYYEALTVRDSSLSACCQAIMAAEVGHVDLAYAYLGEAALMDLDDLENNTRDGLHIASLAGSWLALVAGFGGMRQKGATLTFAPRLPGQLSRLAFKVQTRGRCLRVEIDSSAVTYTLTSGEPLVIVHDGTQLTVSTTRSPRMPLVAPAPEPAPEQPEGRRPAQRP